MACCTDKKKSFNKEKVGSPVRARIEKKTKSLAIDLRERRKANSIEVASKGKK